MQPYDAVILGGGLAGLTLARQLRLEAPHIRVLVVEKRKHPVREAAFKVGESSVEIGAHYSAGRAEARAASARAVSWRSSGCGISSRRATIATSPGASSWARRRFRQCPSFQLDRGRLENLAARRAAAVRRRGAGRLRGETDCARAVEPHRRHRNAATGRRARCARDGSWTPAAAPA